MESVLVIVYMFASYWAAGKTVYNGIMIGTPFGIFEKKLLTGLIFGWVLIPWALLKCLVGR